MSFVVVKASALTIYQNRTPTAVNDQIVDGSNHHLSQFQATTSEFITNPKLNELTVNFDPQLNKENLTITNHIIRTNIIVGASEGGALRGNEERRDLTAGDLKENSSTTTENMRAKLQQLLQRENDNNDEEKQQLQQDLQQQQQQQLYQQSQHAMLTGENAYLLERIDGVGGVGGAGGSMHEQPIYGTWSAKARRPQAPLLAATATTTTTTTSAATAHLQPSSSIQTLMTEIDENLYGRFNNKQQQQQQQQHQHHHYERLPRRSSTMTPVRRELHDQIPRPPRLTSRQPSVALRRQFSDTPLPVATFRDESRPKPFHYPFDGPLPEEFKKIQQSERAVGSGLESDAQVHNIQDILQKLNLGGPGANKVPPLMMMPTGLHISGSFKNLKSSGIGNFFRGKRNKKQIQMQFPMPIPMQMMPNPYQPSIIMQQPYQQRIAMEQFYPFKPRSPGDINLLAMQQQQQQQQKFKNPHSKGKKQKKKQKDKKNSLASSNLMLQQYPYVTAAPEMIFPSMYSPFMSINVTQAPPLQMSKRVPFKVNLDIFPVMPPSKNHKSPAGYAMDEARLVSTMRPPTVLRNPFMEYLTTPITPSAAAALNFYNPYSQKQPLYNPIRFPSSPQNPLVSMAQSNSLQMVYPEQMQKYLQQQQQQQQQQNLFGNYLNTQGHQTPFLPIDCDQPIPSGTGSSQTSPGNSKTNPIMVHLNVFPKQKPASPISTNPFYSNVPHIQRNTIQEESESSLSPIEPRHKGRSLNDTVLTKIERSDSTDTIQQIQPLRDDDDLVDFDHPIVAENSDDNNELPRPSALIGDKPNMVSESSSSFYYESRPNTTTSSGLDSSNINNYNGNMNSNMEQMVSEAKTASLFRFPVEDLIQFQVHDAM